MRAESAIIYFTRVSEATRHALLETALAVASLLSFGVLFG